MPFRTNQHSVRPPQKNGSKEHSGESAFEGRYCTKSRFRCNLLMLNEMLVEAAGVEPSIPI